VRQRAFVRGRDREAVRVRHDGRWKMETEFRLISERGKIRACLLRFNSIACDNSACTCSGENPRA